jgi:hypothetical protein
VSAPLDKAKTSVEIGKLLFDIACTIFDRVKSKRDAEREARVRELEAENAALKASQHL